MQVKTGHKRAARKGNQQPLDILNVPNALITLDTASVITGRSIKSLYRDHRAGLLRFVKHGTRCTRIRAEDLQDFVRRISASEVSA